MSGSRYIAAAVVVLLGARLVAKHRHGEFTMMRARGASLRQIAAVALGIFPSLDEALQAMPVDGDTSEPDNTTAAYEARYRAFRTLVDTLTPWFRTSAQALHGTRG